MRQIARLLKSWESSLFMRLEITDNIERGSLAWRPYRIPDFVWSSTHSFIRLKGSESFIWVLENISKLQEHVRRKGSWYSKDYVLKLKEILNKCPDKKSVIRKALKIPPTSFGRLLKEIRSSDSFWFIPKWRSRAWDYIKPNNKRHMLRNL